MRYDFKRKKLRMQKSPAPTYRNPMFPKYNLKEKILKKGNFFCLLIIIIIAGLIYLIFYSPLFKITKIEISGLQNIPKNYLEEKIIRWQMEQRIFKIFKQNNLLLFSKSWLRKNIENKYPLDDLKVKKKLFHTLKVEIKENLPKLIWVTGNQYYYIETNGSISSQANKESLITGLPFVYDEENNDVSINDEIIPEKMVEFIKNLSNKLTQETKISIDRFSIPQVKKKSTQVNVTTKEGWQIFFEASRDLDSQIKNLQEILDKKINNTKNLQYIDLRIENRVYYK